MLSIYPADLLDLARCNLGNGVPLDLEEANLSFLCGSVVEELRTGFPQTQIMMSADGGITRRCDAARLEQVFTNLIGNAIQHGDSGQPISLALSRNEDRVVFSVQNRGELIPSSAMAHLFEPQARYSSYATSEKGASTGLGLGLFIVAQIVTAHGGEIEVASTVEQGTVFRVMLPVYCS